MLSACGSKKVVTTAAYQNYETECLGKDMDGQQMLRVWGTGLSEKDAIEKAMKQAVYDVTFTGITGGSGDCNGYPVVDEANARQKYDKYFNEFFEHGGKYKKFVQLRSQQKKGAKVYQGDGTQTAEIIVVVDRPGLKKRFEKDKILPKTK
jgi:hypothetical protein